MGADGASCGSTNTETETRPSENTRGATPSPRPRSFRKPSMIFSKPAGTRVTTQPVACRTTSPDTPSSTRQSFGITGHDGATIDRSTGALIDMSVNANCSMPSSFSFRRRALSSSPVSASDLHRAAADAVVADHAEIVEPRQRLLLLGRKRGKDVPERARLDADELGIRVVAAHLALGADEFARGPVEIHELLELAPAVVQVRDVRGFDARTDLVEDRPDVVEFARGLGRTGEPLHRVVGARGGGDEGEEEYRRGESSPRTGRRGMRVLHRSSIRASLRASRRRRAGTVRRLAA